MPTSITMPQLGESVTEGVVARWLKAEGERVERDEPLLEIITDKVNAEMPSPLAGTLVRIVAQEGATIPVGGEIALIEAPGAASEAAPRNGASDRDSSSTATTPAATTGNSVASTGPAEGTAGAQDGAEGTRRYSPVVRRLAQEHHVDLTQISGTGLAGRVTKDDVLAYMAQSHQAASVAGQPAAGQPAAVAAAPSAMPPSAAPKTVAPLPVTRPLVELSPVVAEAAPAVRPVAPERVAGDQDTILPLTPMRRAIAEHMVRSKHTSPHATTMVEVDMTPLVRWREANKDAVKARHGVDVTFIAFVIQAVTDALRAFPIMNSTWADDHIVLKRRINIGVAVGLDDGLVVPVIPDADEKSIIGLARAVADLAERARTNKLTLQDMQGGTFTVNNVGVFGAVVSTPVINQPQAAILAMNAIVKRPVVIDDAIAIRSMMNLTMSFDHRIVDGLASGRFLQRVVQNLANVDTSNL